MPTDCKRIQKRTAATVALQIIAGSSVHARNWHLLKTLAYTGSGL